jgi:hypothetical protein
LPRKWEAIMRKCLLVLGCVAAVLGAVSLMLWLAVPRNRITKVSFDAIEVGMARQRVEEVLGGPPGNYGPDPYAELYVLDFVPPSNEPSSVLSLWFDDGVAVGVWFDREGTVASKRFNQRPRMGVLDRLRLLFGV